VKFRSAPILALPQISPCLFLFLSCVLLTTRFHLSRAYQQNNNFVCQWKMLQAANVRCKICKWATITMNEKCLKLQVWGFKSQMWSVEFSSKQMCVLSEWVRCRIFELVKGRNNKRSQKPPKAYLHPYHHSHRARNHHAKGLSTKGCCARWASTKGIKLGNVVGNHPIFIATLLLG
jgi:hypothetical protein